MPLRFRARALSWPVVGSTPHAGHSVASSGIVAPHLGHIDSLVSSALLMSRLARKSPLSASAFLATTLAVRAGAAPSAPSPTGTLTFVSQPGHFTALPRAESGAFRTFSHVGQRTLTAMRNLRESNR